eukprot:m.44647 g.44647  ORF g.44647 m.44647 type:complete len:765 (-) comp15097_c0_seq7:2042-4336(-)
MPSKKKAPKVDNADLTALDKEHNKKEERRRKEDERRRQEDEEERVLLRRSVLEERAKNKSLQEENEYLQQDIESSKKELDEAIANQKLLKSNYDELKEHADKIESEKMELQRKDTSSKDELLRAQRQLDAVETQHKSELERLLQDMDAERESMERTKQRMQSEKEVMQQSLQAAGAGGDETERLRKQLQVAQTSLQEVQAEREILQNKLYPMQSENKSLQSERNQLEMDLKRVETQRTIQKTASEERDLQQQNEIRDLRSQLSAGLLSVGKPSASDEECERLRTQVRDLTSEVTRLTQQLVEANMRAETTRSELDRLQRSAVSSMDVETMERLKGAYDQQEKDLRQTKMELEQERYRQNERSNAIAREQGKITEAWEEIRRARKHMSTKRQRGDITVLDEQGLPIDLTEEAAVARIRQQISRCEEDLDANLEELRTTRAALEDATQQIDRAHERIQMLEAERERWQHADAQMIELQQRLNEAHLKLLDREKLLHKISILEMDLEHAPAASSTKNDTSPPVSNTTVYVVDREARDGTTAATVPRENAKDTDNNDEYIDVTHETLWRSQADFVASKEQNVRTTPTDRTEHTARILDATVQVQPSRSATRLGLRGKYLLRIAPNGITLFDAQHPPHSDHRVMFWRLDHIKRYGDDEHCFSVEVGKAAGPHYGVFFFETRDAPSMFNALNDLMVAAARALTRHHAHARGIPPTGVAMRRPRDNTDGAVVVTSAQSHSTHSLFYDTVADDDDDNGDFVFEDVHPCGTRL